MDNSYIEIHKKVNMRNFRNIFIGFFIINLNFMQLTIYNIDMLPDFIGYIFIFKGIFLFLDNPKIYKNAKTITTILLVVSIFSIFKFPLNSITWTLFFLLMAKDIILAILNLLLIYYICSWIINTAQTFNQEQFIVVARKYWKIILYTSIATIVLFIFSRYFYYNTTTYLLYITALISSLVPLMILLKKSYNELDGKEITEFCSRV